jgi:glycosyltransferase involved in cell wall biosynthesis
MPANNVTFLGWKSQTEAVKILTDCDFLYCTYPFDPLMAEVSRQSFPSKLVLYLAAGRPVVFHGPAYASVAEFIGDRGCGILATSLNAEGLLKEIERLVENQKSYSEMASNAQKTFLDEFTLESMARSFNDFIGAEPTGVMVLHDHTRRDEELLQPDRLPSSRRRSLQSFVVRCGKIARKILNKIRVGLV